MGYERTDQPIMGRMTLAPVEDILPGIAPGTKGLEENKRQRQFRSVQPHWQLLGKFPTTVC